MSHPRVVVLVWSLVLAAAACGACLTAPDPRAALYGAERLRCVHDYDAAAEARACMSAVDRLYGQDGGGR